MCTWLFVLVLSVSLSLLLTHIQSLTQVLQRRQKREQIDFIGPEKKLFAHASDANVRHVATTESKIYMQNFKLFRRLAMWLR